MAIYKNENQGALYVKIVVAIVIIIFLGIAIIISTKSIPNKQNQQTPIPQALVDQKTSKLEPVNNSNEPISIFKKKTTISQTPKNIMSVTKQFIKSLDHHVSTRQNEATYIQELNKKIMLHMQQRLIKEGNQRLFMQASTTRWPAVSICYKEDNSMQVKLKKTTGSKKLDDIYIQSIKEAFLYAPIPKELLATEFPVN